MKNFDDINYDIELVPLEMIEIGVRFDRRDTKDLKIDELAQDIKLNGMHTEIWLKKESETEFVLIAGYRRYLAMKNLKEKEIRAKIIVTDTLTASYLTCSENSNRLNYNKFEKIENFLYLLHLEICEVEIENTPVFNYHRYINAFKDSIYYLREKESGQLSKDKKLTSTQKRAVKFVEKVYNKSGLFPSYATFHNTLRIFEMPSYLRVYSVKHSLAVSVMQKLITADKRFTNKLMPPKNPNNPDEKPITVMSSILKELEKDIESARKYVTPIYNKHLRIVENMKTSKFDDIEKDFAFAIEDLKGIIKKKDLAAVNKRRIIRLLKSIEDEIELLYKIEESQKNKKKKKRKKTT